MRLSADEAHIAEAKLRRYLLSTSHPDGHAKAEYLGRLGYSEADWARLDADLRAQHLSRDAVPAAQSAYGEKYEILGPLTGPNGKTAWIRSIWIILRGEHNARLVTLVPEERP
jgi:filamentous hemagglutinin